MNTDELHKEMLAGFARVETRVETARRDLNSRLRKLEAFRAFTTGVVAAIVVGLGSMAAWIGLIVR